MPTYVVTNRLAPEGTQPRVVEAPLPGSARAHVAATDLVVSKIEVSAAMKLARDGVQLEVAGEAVPEQEERGQEFPLPDKKPGGEGEQEQEEQQQQDEE